MLCFRRGLRVELWRRRLGFRRAVVVVARGSAVEVVEARGSVGGAGPAVIGGMPSAKRALGTLEGGAGGGGAS